MGMILTFATMWLPRLLGSLVSFFAEAVKTRLGCAAIAAVLAWFGTDIMVRREWRQDLAARAEQVRQAIAKEGERQDGIAEMTREAARGAALAIDAQDAANDDIIKEIENAAPLPPNPDCKLPAGLVRQLNRIK